ncbi:acyltransferase family protein [Candidatus Enterococcus willemsii]|uniref:Acyltransferase n=1 Tax=Candidatus Enterococcus willemsii TaxID=1857215 RepID=A0ABQ6YZI9_9ENTE|nr:acyltransferase family protein [Enterococcus sp. CU12B]KAF1303787.1 acyltransferase [Enterococcus sp. CU12B]
MSKKIRDPFFDNAKFLLMVLVVFGHLLQPFIEQTAWSQDLYFSIYTFHMPAFILISGYFAKSFDRKKGMQIRISFQKFILPYIFFQWLYSFFYWLVGSKEFSFQLHIPNWSLWFLISSFFWQLSLYFFEKVPAKIGIPVSLLVSLLVGYIPFFGRELTLQRTAVFLPFFVMGYYLPHDKVNKFIHSSKKWWWTLGFVGIYGLIHSLGGLNKYIFFGSKPYEDFLNFPEWGALVRIVTWCLACVGILAFFACVPTKQKRYTAYGQYTLVAYLLHGFIIQGLRGLGIQSLSLNVWMLMALIVGSILLTYLLASEPVGQMYAAVEQKLLGYHHKKAKSTGKS